MNNLGACYLTRQRWSSRQSSLDPCRRCQRPGRHRAPAGAVARASRRRRQGDRRRRVPAALARPRAIRVTDSSPTAPSDGGQDRVLPESAHRDPARRRHADRRRHELTWHAVDTINYNVNLYHFAYALNKPTSNVLFWVVTVVNAPREMPGVRLAIGSNAASVWWVNGRKSSASTTTVRRSSTMACRSAR